MGFSWDELAPRGGAVPHPARGPGCAVPTRSDRTRGRRPRRTQLAYPRGEEPDAHRGARGGV